jgi:hypothetical protein
MADAETDAGTDAGTDAEHDARADTRFGGLTPSEAAQRRWAQAREKEFEPDARRAISSALESKARRGDVNAAREYREWIAMRGMDEADQNAWMRLLTPRERGIVGRLIERALART